ncbi:hypothetical protein ElyMa_001327100 [Elysia marginata]|uniref:Uncharacterized protein n=1 Tax=Elysia marginata TaxID=1093978 RepID=A0AAV4IEM3_9GAST|nr:hypothetical protein ElyMa_001327100 [Elysia marginata]
MHDLSIGCAFSRLPSRPLENPRKSSKTLENPTYIGAKHNNLEKLCLEGAVEGRRGRGRPRRRWTQDISDWLGFSVREASILAQDRDGFRSAVWEATSYKDPP